MLCFCISITLINTTKAQLIKTYERFSKKMAGYEYISNDHDPEASFLMSTSEITNLDYLEFLHDIKKIQGKEAFDNMMPDTALWINFPRFGQTLVEVYHDHPAYHDFPAVNIKHEQAVAYCEWLEGVLSTNEWIKGYQVEVKLPSVQEWTYAATGADSANYLPWPGEELQYRGMTRAYYNRISQFDILRDANDSLQIAESSFYYPYPSSSNTFLGDVHDLETGFWGLAHMAGNASEFVAERGIKKGGSWQDPAYYLMNKVSQTYEGSGASISTGFRVLVKLTPEQVN